MSKQLSWEPGTLQWEAAGNWGKDEPPYRGERVDGGKQLN